MAGSYDAIVSRYLTLSGPSTDFGSSEWTLFAMFYPDTSITPNSAAYVYAHGTPSSNTHAVNIWKVNSGNFMRVRVDVPAGTIITNDTAAVVDDAWNAIAVSWDNPNFRVWLNGTLQSTVLSPFGSVTPTPDPRIGYATFGGSREWNGRICHVAKWSRGLTLDEGAKYTQTLVSPQYAQQDADWHVEMFRGGVLANDLVGSHTVTETSMVYGPQAHVDYPDEHYMRITAPPVGTLMSGPQETAA